MAATIRDWQQHGVTLKVELATSGGLVIGGTLTEKPFVTGGEYGAPLGYDAGEYFSGNAGNEGAYNWTTVNDTGIFSVSNKVAGTRSAGLWGSSFPITPGATYQVGIQARQMAGKATSDRSFTLETSNNGGSTWFYRAGVSSTGAQAQPDWEPLLDQAVIPAGHSLGRFIIMGGPEGSTAVLWGTQFRGLFLKQLDVAPPPITWMDISCDVQSIAVRYGRERFTNRYDVSTLQIDLVNNEGLYSFHNPHPFGLAPGRQVRVTATYNSVTYPLAFHVLDSMVDTYSLQGNVIAHWACTDPTSILSKTPVQSNTSQYPDGGGERIGILLDQVGYAPRLLDANVWNMQAIAASGRTIRDEAGVTADSEGGNFFADRVGNCVYKNRNWASTDTNLTEVTADLVSYPHSGGGMPLVDNVPTKSTAPIICTTELATDWSLDRVINEVSLANAGGTAQVFVDEESMKQYGPQTYQRHDFVLWSDYYLQFRAADIMTGYAEPVLRVNSVGFAPGMSGAWEWTLSVFLNWLVRVWYSHPTEFWGYAICVHVQSVEHRITPTDWETTMSVDVPTSFVELEWSSINGWDGGLWDEALWDQGDETAGALWTSGYTWSNPTSKWGI